MKKILIICSKKFYDRIPEVKKQLNNKFDIYLPNCYDVPKNILEDEINGFGPIVINGNLEEIK